MSRGFPEKAAGRAQVLCEMRRQPGEDPFGAPRRTRVDELDGVDGRSLTDLLNVGSLSPKGDGLWGHADLAGNVNEWNLDGYDDYPMPCIDCANFSGARKVKRGGGFGLGAGDGSFLLTARRDEHNQGLRCARSGP